MDSSKQIQTPFLLGVFCYDSHSLKNSTFAGEKAYPDLKKLKGRIEKNQNGPQHRPYSANKKRVLVYQGIFLLFSLLFFTLLALIYYKTTNWTCSLYFGNCMRVKTAVCTLTMFLSLSALWASFIMRTEKETVYHLAKRAKKRLRRIFSKRRAERGITGFFLLGDQLREARLMKHCKKESEEKIEDKLIEVLLLINQVKQSKDIDSKSKEDLYNQAILEFHDQLHAVVLAA